jgi:hypothetical protein
MSEKIFLWSPFDFVDSDVERLAKRKTKHSTAFIKNSSSTPAPMSTSKLSASPSRERADANTLLNQLMKKVELARRGKSAEMSGFRTMHDDQVRSRREEVLQDSKAAAMLRRLRDEQDKEALKRRRATEEQRKEVMRNHMFEDFEDRRSRVYSGKDKWKESAALQSQELDARAAERRQTVKELREQHQQQRYLAEERLAREREEMREARTKQKKADEQYMAGREAQREEDIKTKVHSVREMTRAKQDALDAVYERNRAARQHVLSVNEALRRRELRDIADRMSRLQQELSRLN